MLTFDLELLPMLDMKYPQTLLKFTSSKINFIHNFVENFPASCQNILK